MDDQGFSIDTSNFYNNIIYENSLIRKKIENIEEKEKLYKIENYSMPKYKFLNYIWMEFHTLKSAYEYLESQKIKGLRIFSKEKCKCDEFVFSFIVTNHDSFWYEYSSLKDDCRHFYEVILKNKPCKLYLDLEFPIEFNKNTDGDKLVFKMIQLITSSLKL
ncbi:hypothetical protein MXB_766 [Myxobolus squamalis]|nr:hypothetical protein MXB_766 [Myxobolus squamalis]